MVDLSKIQTLYISRFCYSDVGTFGTMVVDGQTLYTAERPWIDNRPRISCIPTGRYRCVPRFYNRGGYEAVEVTNVPKRSHILFHVGNQPMADSLGCLLVGARLGCLNDVWAVKESALAFKLFMTHYNRDFQLIIEDYRPLSSSPLGSPTPLASDQTSSENQES